MDGDLVAIGHSAFINKYNNQTLVKFGLYFVVLLAKESESVKNSEAKISKD